MSDITNANLQNLLDQAAPGPWESSAGAYGVSEEWDEYWLALHMGHTCLSTMQRDEPLPEEAYASSDLAALAPELAQEIIRLRAHPNLPAPTRSFSDGTKAWIVEDDEGRDIASIYIFNGEILLRTHAGSVKGAPAKMRKIGLAVLAAANCQEEA